MKNNYLKSIGLVLFLGMLSLFIYGFSLDDSSTISMDKVTNPAKVPLKEVKRDIAAYQMWLKFLPKQISINKEKRNLTYHMGEISDEDWGIAMKYLNDIFPNGIPEKIPFYNELNYSYFINKTEIMKALKELEDYEEKPFTEQGINVYLGMRNFRSSDNFYDIESHLYVVPALQINNPSTIPPSYLVDKIMSNDKGSYALDLTDPCPRLCDEISPLYMPTLESPEKE